MSCCEQNPRKKAATLLTKDASAPSVRSPPKQVHVVNQYYCFSFVQVKKKDDEII